MSTFEHKGARKQIRSFIELPLQILKQERNESAEWYFSDGSTKSAHCISCINEPCRLLSKSERTLDNFDAFAADSSSALCPVKAISWDQETETPSIDSSQCIGCGICVVRCPVGAISLADEVAKVSVSDQYDSKPVTELQSLELAYDIQNAQLAVLPKIQFGEAVADDGKVAPLTSSLAGASNTVQKSTVRSLIIAAGGSVSLSRRGDVHTRMDGAFLLADDAVGPLEIEFGSDSLEAVRACLDDVAVLNSRFGLDKFKQIPLVICAFLPRERQGYWQVVNDIHNVLNLKVRTVSVGALFLLVWNGKKLTAEVLNELTPHFESTSIREEIETVLNREVSLPIGLGGILEPEK